MTMNKGEITMLHSINLLNNRIKQLKRTATIIKLIIFILLIWNIALQVQINNDKNILTSTEQATEQLAPVPVDLPEFDDDIKQTIINNESI